MFGYDGTLGVKRKMSGGPLKVYEHEIISVRSITTEGGHEGNIALPDYMSRQVVYCEHLQNNTYAILI